jgi:hypothetical protein
MGTLKGAVYGAPIGRDERSKGFPERKKLEGGPFGYLDLDVSLDRNHNGGERERSSAQ